MDAPPKQMEANPHQPERFAPSPPLRDDVPFPPAEAVVDDDDERDSDLAKEDEPGGGEDDGPPDGTQLSGSDV